MLRWVSWFGDVVANHRQLPRLGLGLGRRREGAGGRGVLLAGDRVVALQLLVDPGAVGPAVLGQAGQQRPAQVGVDRQAVDHEGDPSSSPSRSLRRLVGLCAAEA